MSLSGALQVGRSAINVSQVALQVAGNNMANAATPGFHRQSVHLTPLSGEMVGRNAFVGRGVDLQAIRREVDTALQSRLRDAISQEHAAQIDQRFLTALETLQNELTDNDLSSVLSEFFNAFSELANNPEDNAVRSVVIQQGETVANLLADTRRDHQVIIGEIDRALGASLTQVNDVLDQLEEINLKIAQSEGGGGQANSLRDQRDVLIDELSQYFEVGVIEHANGSVDVLVNSIPIFLAGQNRGIELRTQSVDDKVEVSVRVATDGTTLRIDSGEIGGLLRQREESVQPFIDNIDEFTSQLIYQVNRLHSQGQGQSGFETLTGTYANQDAAANLNSADANLPFKINNGSFFIHVAHKETGIRTTHQINIDGNADSLDDLIDRINNVVNVPNVTAGKGLSNMFTLDAAAGYEFSFSDDTSGALTALGINSFFVGSNATDIAVNDIIANDPKLLAAGSGHIAGSNGTALAIADLQNASLDELSGSSLREFWLNSVNTLAVKTSAANADVAAAALVRESLQAQVQAVSGVSLDEEAINLLTYQRQFQAAARYITVIDEMLQTLLTIAR